MEMTLADFKGLRKGDGEKDAGNGAFGMKTSQVGCVWLS
jgi:hypothetical protein